MERREFLLGGGLVAAGGLLNVSAFSRSAPFKEYRDYDALGLAELLRKGDVSAMELLETAIARVETIDPAINAVVLRHYDLAKAAIKRGLPQGPFTGVPFLLKVLTTYSINIVFCRFPLPHAWRRIIFRSHKQILVSAWKTILDLRSIAFY